MGSVAIADLLLQYDNGKPACEELAVRTERLLTDLLRGAKLRTHSVTSRVKERKSLERKLTLGEGKYGSLADVTDIVGIRVITYFPDEVDAAASLVEKEFEVDEANSSDRRASLDPDRFGYLSLHYVVEHDPTRLRLPEWQAHSGQRFEVQIRSILQHAWAEIEHDLGYKSEGGVPRPVRRRFSRLAGLLEIADEEFAKLRDDITLYQSSVKSAVVNKPAATAIDQDSIAAFVRRSSAVRSLDASLAEIFRRPLRPKIEPAYMARQVERLQALGVSSIEDLEQRLRANAEGLLKFADRWIGRDLARNEAPPRGVCLFYLSLLGAAQQFRDPTDDKWTQLFAWGPRRMQEMPAKAISIATDLGPAGIGG